MLSELKRQRRASTTSPAIAIAIACG